MIALAVFGPVVAVVSMAPAAFVASVTVIALPTTLIVSGRLGASGDGLTTWYVIALPRSVPTWGRARWDRRGTGSPSAFDSSMTAEFCCVVEQVAGVAKPAGLAPTGVGAPIAELPVVVDTAQPMEATAGRM